MIKRLRIQIIIILGIGIFTFIAINNLYLNLIRTGVGINFNWLLQPSGFAISESVLPYNPRDSYAWVLVVAWVNSLKVIIFGLLISTIIGILVGISRTSSNSLLRNISAFYIALVRQIPLLLQLLFWYFVAFLGLSEDPTRVFGNLIILSNQGIKLLGLNLTVEFTALLIGLSLFTGASIAEIVRGGINSVSLGQWEAFRSLGFTQWDGIQRIIIPQSLPAIIPGLTSQYLNLAKNSTLAIAIGYSDIYAVSDTTITQTGRAIEGFIILLTSFLLLNLIINRIMEKINTYVNRYKI